MLQIAILSPDELNMRKCTCWKLRLEAIWSRLTFLGLRRYHRPDESRTIELSCCSFTA